MSRPLKILLATDGSDSALAVTDFLMGMPLPRGTQVTIVTVLKELLHEDEIAGLPADRRAAYAEMRSANNAEAQAMLDSEAERLRASGLAVDTRILTGHAAEEIVRTATDEHYRIIAIGTHGTHDPQHFHLGSVSDRVFEYAPCSVLIVRPASTQADSDQEMRILLAYDDSPPARAAVELCASLPLPRETRVKAVTAMPLIHMFRQDVRQQLSWVWQEKKEKARMALDWVTAEIDWKDLEVTTELVESADVAQAILASAVAFDSDLVVIGHKGKRKFERFLLGSVTAHVTHHAPCSVLVVRECA